MLKKSFKPAGILASTIALSAGLGWSQSADAAEPFLAEIKMFGGNFAPRGYAFCDGQLLPISQNTAVFSLLGTTFGGDGRTTFGLPDLRGRTAVHPGTGPGLSNIRWGQKSGAENVVLSVANLPSHNHTAATSVSTSVSATLNGTNSAGDSSTPGSNTLASKSRTNIYSTSAPDVSMHASSISATATSTATTTVNNTGGNQPFSIRDPYLGIYHIIALQGIFPSRN